MPSREEIVEWIRGYKILAKEVFESKSILESALQDIENKAAQVEAMRCERCKHYEPSYTEPRTYNGIPSKCFRHFIRGQGPDFGCFSHEQKV